MNDQERYLFDLKGYLAVPDALSQEQVAKLNSVLDEHIAAECPPDMRTHRFGPVLDWGKDYLDLIDNPGSLLTCPNCWATVSGSTTSTSMSSDRARDR